MSKNRDADGRKTAFCPSCEKVRPIAYGYVTQAAGAITTNLGGPISPTRVITETTQETFCSACGHRVFTEEEIEAKEREKEEARKWFLILMLGILSFATLIIWTR